MLKYNLLTLDNPHNLLHKYYKKVLNWEGLGIKLRYSLEKKTFIGNENILPKFLIAAKENIFKPQYSTWYTWKHLLEITKNLLEYIIILQ